MENELTTTERKQREHSMKKEQVIVATIEFEDEYDNSWYEHTVACIECLNKSGRPWSAWETDPGTDIWMCSCGRTSGGPDLDCMFK